MTTTVQLPARTRSIIRRLRDDEGMCRALVPVIDRENELTVAEIVETRLSSRGPETLGVRTGRLRRSIRPAKATVSGNSVVSGIGSNVKYLGVHEFGFDDDVQVRPFMRKQFKRQVIFGRRKKVRQGDIQVRGYKRHMTVRERAPLRRGIAQRQGAYQNSVLAKIVQFYEAKS